MQRSIVFAQREYDALTSHLFSDITREQGAFLLAATGNTEHVHKLVVHDVVPLSDADFIEQKRDLLIIKPHALARVMKRASQEGWSVILVHTHPFSSDVAGFSPVDDEGECRVFETISKRVAGRAHASMVFGQRAVAARMWQGNTVMSVDRVVVIGPQLSITETKEPPFYADERYDRQVRAFSAEGQRALSRLTIGIVGCGGTGSVVAEQLLRLGVGRILAIDPDNLEVSNISRVYGSTVEDLRIATAKVDIVARLAKQIGRPNAVETIQGDIRDPSIACRLAEADVLIGCTDSHQSRLLLNLLVEQYLIPLIDLGTRIDARDGALHGVIGRVSIVLPGTTCLICCGIIRPEMLAAESLPAEELQKQQDEGYVQGLQEAAPSVISLNTVVAGLAVTELLRMTTGWGPAIHARQLLYNALDGTMKTVTFSAAPHCWCKSGAHYAMGDRSSLPTALVPLTRVRSGAEDCTNVSESPSSGVPSQ